MKLTIKSSVKSLPESFQAEASAGKHVVRIDEPESNGGTDTGMNPVELMLSGLGACQVLGAKLFAQAIGFKFEEITVEVEGDADTDALISEEDGVYRGLNEIRCYYHIKTDEPEEKVQQFIKLIDARCPVSETLKNEVKVIQSGYEIH